MEREKQSDTKITGQKLLQTETWTLSHSMEDTSDSTLGMLEVKPPARFDQKEWQATPRCYMAYLLLIYINKKWLSGYC